VCGNVSVTCAALLFWCKRYLNDGLTLPELRENLDRTFTALETRSIDLVEA